MRITNGLVVAALAVAAAACNESRSGANDRIRFTPDECGNVGGCDFDDSIGAGGTISVRIGGIDGYPTAGIELASRDEAVLSVVPRADIANETAWDVVAHAPGVADLVAVDDGEEIDFIEVAVQEVTALTMLPFAGDIVESTEAGYDEAFTVAAGDLVSWHVRPLIARDAVTMGRFEFVAVTDAGSTLLDHEASSSDRPSGFLSLDTSLPPGDYPITFELAADADVRVDAIIHALAP